METRMQEQAKLYTLVLNPVNSQPETNAVAAVATSYEALAKFYNDALLSPEKRYCDDGGVYRSFVEGPLFYFNPCTTIGLGERDEFNRGVHVEWVPVESLSTVRNRHLFID